MPDRCPALLLVVLALALPSTASAQIFVGAHAGVIFPTSQGTLEIETSPANSTINVSDSSLLDVQLHVLGEVWRSQSEVLSVDVGVVGAVVPFGNWSTDAFAFDGDRGLVADLGLMARLHTPVPLIHAIFAQAGATLAPIDEVNLDRAAFEGQSEDQAFLPLGFHLGGGFMTKLPFGEALRPYFGAMFKFSRVEVFSGADSSGQSYRRTLGWGRIELFFGGEFDFSTPR